MKIFAIILAVLLAAFLGVVVVRFVSTRFLIKRADKTRALCVVREHRKTRVPGLWSAVVEYSGKNHKRYAAATRGMRRSELPRVGSRRYGTVCRVTGRDGSPVYWVEMRASASE